MRVSSVFFIIICLITLSSSAMFAQSYESPAVAPSVNYGYSGYSGNDQDMAETPAAPLSQTPAPVSPAVPQPSSPTPPTGSAAAPVAATGPAAPEVVDPCASYTYSYDAYTLCHDRMVKIQRMKDAKGKRTQKREPTPVPATTAPETEPAAPAKTDSAQEQKPEEKTEQKQSQ